MYLDSLLVFIWCYGKVIKYFKNMFFYQKRKNEPDFKQSRKTTKPNDRILWNKMSETSELEENQSRSTHKNRLTLTFMPPPQQKQEVTDCVTKIIDKVKQSSARHPLRPICALLSQMTELRVHLSYCSALNITYHASQSVFLHRNLSVPTLRWISLSRNRYLQPASLFLISQLSADSGRNTRRF